MLDHYTLMFCQRQIIELRRLTHHSFWWESEIKQSMVQLIHVCNKLSPTWWHKIIISYAPSDPTVQIGHSGSCLSLFQCLRLQMEDSEIGSWNHLKVYSPICWMAHVSWYLSWTCWLDYLYKASTWHHLLHSTMIGSKCGCPTTQKVRQKLYHLLWPGFGSHTASFSPHSVH